MAPIVTQLKAASASACRKNHTYILAARTIAFLSCCFLLNLFIRRSNVRAFSYQTTTDFSPENEEEANISTHVHENVVNLLRSGCGRASEFEYPDPGAKKGMLAVDTESAEPVTDQDEGYGVHETALSPDSGGIEASRPCGLEGQGSRLPQGVQAVLVVSKERRRGHFPTVQAAVNAIPIGTNAKWIVHIKPGVYYETVVVPRGKNHITFIGEGPTVTTLSCQRSARDSPMGIQGCPCVIIEASYFIAKDIAFENTSPKPDLEDRESQAPAIRISGDNSSFFGCFFLGWQDTLYADQGRQYYENCRIEGNVDFILGYARALFNNCTIYSRSRGFITAQSRWCDSADCPASSSVFVFLDCYLKGFGPTYLGRPWREYAKVVYIGNRMASHIAPQGWDDWLDGQRPAFSHDKVYFAESHSRGPGRNPSARVLWSRQIGEAEVQANSYRNVTAFLDADEWLRKPQSIADLLNSNLTVFIPDAFTDIYGDDLPYSEGSEK